MAKILSSAILNSRESKLNFKYGSVIFTKKPVYTGNNNEQNCIKNFMTFGKSVKYTCTHAEVSVLKRLYERFIRKEKIRYSHSFSRKMKKYKIITARTATNEKDGITILSGRPCMDCYEFIRKMNIKKLYYTTLDINGNISLLKINTKQRENNYPLTDCQKRWKKLYNPHTFNSYI